MTDEAQKIKDFNTNQKNLGPGGAGQAGPKTNLSASLNRLSLAGLGEAGLNYEWKLDGLGQKQWLDTINTNPEHAAKVYKDFAFLFMYYKRCYSNSSDTSMQSIAFDPAAVVLQQIGLYHACCDASGIDYHPEVENMLNATTGADCEICGLKGHSKGHCYLNSMMYSVCRTYKCEDANAHYRAVIRANAAFEKAEKLAELNTKVEKSVTRKRVKKAVAKAKIQ